MTLGKKLDRTTKNQNKTTQLEDFQALPAHRKWGASPEE